MMLPLLKHSFRILWFEWKHSKLGRHYSVVTRLNTRSESYLHRTVIVAHEYLAI